MQTTKEKGIDTRIKQQQLCCQEDCQKLGTVCTRHFLGIRFMLCEDHTEAIIKDLKNQLVSTQLRIFILPNHTPLSISKKQLIENTDNGPFENIKCLLSHGKKNWNKAMQDKWNKITSINITNPEESITYIFTKHAIQRLDLPERYINLDEIMNTINDYIKEKNINIEKDEFIDKEFFIQKNKIKIPIMIQRNKRILLKSVYIHTIYPEIYNKKKEKDDKQN